MSIAYLSSPYNHQDSEVKEERFQKVSYMANKLMGQGIHVFSPISHNVPISRHGDLEWAEWMAFDLAMLAKCNRMFVLKLEGWDKSKGIAQEIAYALTNNIPIEYLAFPVEEFEANTYVPLPVRL